MVYKGIKFLIVTLVVAVVAVSGCTQSTPQYEEQNDTQNDTQYRMEMMDYYAKDGIQAVKDYYHYTAYAEIYLEDYNLDDAASSLAAADESLNRADQCLEEASKYAEGPYKEYLEMLIENLNILRAALDSYNSALDALYAGDYEGYVYYLEEVNMYEETLDQKNQEVRAFLDEHPDVYQHVLENWNK